MGYTYRSAGVGHEEQEELNRAAAEAVRRTVEALGARVSLEEYAPAVEHGGEWLSLHMDGVGTKTLVLERTGELWVAGWDCVAMNVNDLAVAGYRPLALADYVAMPRPDPGALREILRGAALAAVEAGAPLIGGETAVLPGLAGGVDVVCAALGVRLHTPRRAGPGSVFLGVESSGLHANGYSLARRIIEDKLGSYDATVEGVHLGRELSKPTVIYSGLVLEAYRRGLAFAAAHLTGGGWAKLLRILEPGVEARLRAPEPPAVFRVLQQLGGVETGEMYRTFNMGVGLVLATTRERLGELQGLVAGAGLRSFPLGEAAAAEGGAKRLVIEAPGGEAVVIEG